jgi:hypothetical protein
MVDQPLQWNVQESVSHLVSADAHGFGTRMLVEGHELNEHAALADKLPVAPVCRFLLFSSPVPSPQSPASRPCLHSLIRRILIAAVERQHRFESIRADLPDGIVIGVGITMRDEQPVHELEQMPRHAQAA